MIPPTPILMMKYRIPEGWNILLNVPEQVAPRIPEWSSWREGRKMDCCAAGTCPSALCLHLSCGAQVSPHLTFQRLYISCEIMRCGMEAGRIYRAVKCSLVSKVWLHYSMWHSKDHLCPLAFGWISRSRPRLRKHCQLFLYSLILLSLSAACNALAYEESGKINIAFFFF